MIKTIGFMLSIAVISFSQITPSTSRFDFQTGKIQLGDGVAQIDLPVGYKYLNPNQSTYVLETLWGNPPGEKTLGMIFPENTTPLDTNSWAVVIQYTDDGYVKDKDANKINYDKLLKQMQKATAKENENRLKSGYESVEIIGWAEKPFYDNEAKKLYWAKEIKFGNSPNNFLNYDIRILGRKGYLVLTVVSTMAMLNSIKPFMPQLVKAAEFNTGYSYAEFDPKVDKVAAYGVAGLIAGGLLMKAGLFKVIIAGIIALKKFIIIGLIALMAIITQFFKKRKNTTQNPSSQNPSS